MTFLIRHSALFLGLALICYATGVTFAEDPEAVNRQAIEDGLFRISARAQKYYHTPSYEGGGGGSFATLTLSSIIARPCEPYGCFVLSSPSSVWVVFTGVGIEKGMDGMNPIEIEVIVYPDSMSAMVHLN